MVHIIHNVFMVLEVCHTEVIYSRMVERRGYHKNRECQQRVTLKQHSWNIHVSHFCAKKPQYQHCIIILQLVCSIRLARMWAFSKYAKVLCIWEHNTMDFILQMLLPVLDFEQHIHVHNNIFMYTTNWNKGKHLWFCIPSGFSGLMHECPWFQDSCC